MNKEQCSRFKGATWFDLVNDNTLVIIGAGGTGSWATLLLASLGKNTIFVIDYDSYEEHNLSGQFVEIADVGKTKVDALHDSVYKFTETSIRRVNAKYGAQNAYRTPYMISCLDNMKYRKIAYNDWKSQFKEGDTGVFIDPRMNADAFQIYIVTYGLIGSESRQAAYEKTLVDDKDIPDGDCTFKQTRFVAAIVGGYITEAFINFKRLVAGDDFAALPFKIEHDANTITTTSSYQ